MTVSEVVLTLILTDIYITLMIQMPPNEAAADKIRKYRADYNNNPPNAISFMTAIASTSGRLHSEIIILLFLQAIIYMIILVP